MTESPLSDSGLPNAGPFLCGLLPWQPFLCGLLPWHSLLPWHTRIGAPETTL